jgi:hypothetical protein
MKTILVLGLLLAACGGGGSGDDVDAGPPPDCGFASDRYLPYQVGFQWTYQVTDPATSTVDSKMQWVDSEVTWDGDGQPALLQITDKSPGQTKNFTRLMGDAIVRLEQEDWTGAAVLDRTTTYDPYAIRIDEAAERIADGAMFDESFIEREYDGLGVLSREQPATETWQVMAASEACQAPIGSFADCLHLRRVRVGAQTTQKDFWFVRGVGKVREEGGQTEALQSCGTM